MAATLETTEERSRKRTRYSEEEIERGLLVLALNGGRDTNASRELAQLGHRIPAQTLQGWRTGTYADRYTALASDAQAKVRERIATHHERIVFAATEAQAEALDQFRTHLAQGNIPRDKLAGDIRNLATAAGINADKAANARDRPSAIVEHRGSQELYSAMRGLGIEVIDGQAEEITDTQAVDEIPATSGDLSPQRTPNP